MRSNHHRLYKLRCRLVIKHNFVKRTLTLGALMRAQTYPTSTLRMYYCPYYIVLSTDTPCRYSDSEDEDRPQSFNPPEWAQSPNLQSALETMRTVNPDTIFGAVPKLEMEEIFPGRRGNKFRVRTSSANWAGADGVTVEEEIEYAKRMGFTD